MSRTWHVALPAPDDVAGWRAAAQRLDQAGIAPDLVQFTVKGDNSGLFAGEELTQLPDNAGETRAVPADLGELANLALRHRDPERFSLLYRILWRTRSQPELLKIASDPDVDRAQAMAKAVGRDRHKMTAFVRFREIVAPDGREVFIAWFEPSHHIVALTAPFFVRRFANMRWSILTPEASAHWDLATLTLGPGAARGDAPGEDRLEAAWLTYYASIFNPARLKVKAMTAEMPKKYWHNLPEAALIPQLIRGAEARAKAMVAAAPTVLERRVPQMVKQPSRELPLAQGETSLPDVARDAAGCTRCDLYRHATQTVGGQGPPDAELMLVGEQPGDREDLSGQPFVGPAGNLLDIALERAGIDRARVYVTNAVKHFKFEPRGKRRIHKRPDAGEVDTCRYWLDQERALLKPKLIVALGATAARGVLGKSVKVGEMRGVVRPLPDGSSLLVTVHPSYLLRLTDEADKRTEWHAFLADLRVAQAFLEGRDQQ